MKKKNEVEPKAVEIKEKDDRLAAVQAVLKKIDQQYGKGTIVMLGEKPKISGEKLSTGILPLDLAVGIGGLPKGRIVEIFGPESAGKTLIALQTAAETQRNGGLVAYIDVEHALCVEFAAKIGVDVNSLLVCQPDSGEQALTIAEQLIRSGGIDLIILDSVASLTPQAEIDGEMGDAHVGLLARLMSQCLRKITGAISKTNTTMIFINQLREKVGNPYGNPETTPGGRALKFYSSVRLEVRKKETLKNGTDAIGNRVRVKVVKNKVAPPFKECEFDIMFESGVSKYISVIDVAISLDIINKAGSWFSYGETKIGQGKETVKKYLESNPKVFDEIYNKIYQVMGAENETPDSKNTNPAENNENDFDDLEETESFTPTD